MKSEDYTHRSWIGALALIAVLTGLSLIPPQRIGGVELRRANILSELIAFDDASTAAESEPALYDEAEFEVYLTRVAERIVADTAPRRAPVRYDWTIGRPPGCRAGRRPDTVRCGTDIVPVEDFDTTAYGAFRRFCDTLLGAQRPVRIAVLGDSFVEGDILTADLRERLQSVYGGGGTGFAPMASPLTAFRRTVKTQSKGWTAYNIMQRKNAPQPLRDNFYVSGWVCAPQPGASTRWECTDFRERLDSCTGARILFRSPHDAETEVTVNDTLTRRFAIEGDEAVRQIFVAAPQIRSLAFRVLSGTEGFVGYGARFEGTGVEVDNYSVRSNNGQAMFWTNPSVNAQIDAMLNYDLVILQYGLNIMQPGVTNYARYAEQIEKMVAYVRRCFPSAAVLVMGVSERSTRGEQGFAPMDALPHMLRWQREAAQRTGAAFWNTCEAMRARGGMERFVANGWAGKDYTHINYAGGRQVALALFDALHDCARQQAETPAVREAAANVVDAAKLDALHRCLTPAIAPLPLNPPLQ